MIPRYTVYVELPKVVMETTCLIVQDEDDMKRQLAKRELQFREQPFAAKPERDKQGKVRLHQLSADWNVENKAETEHVPSIQEKMWSTFIEHLNAVNPLKDDAKHKNFLGSVESYRKIFMEANGANTRTK